MTSIDDTEPQEPRDPGVAEISIAISLAIDSGTTPSGGGGGPGATDVLAGGTAVIAGGTQVVAA